MLHSQEKTVIIQALEAHLHGGKPGDEKIKVFVLPPGKTVYIEQNGQDSRSVMLDEYRIEGKVIRAGYSSRSGTVYISMAPG